MNAITEVFDAFMDMVDSVHSPSVCVIGAMPPHNGYAAQITTGATDTTYLDKGIEIGLSIVLNGKNEIHQSLTMTKDYPSTGDYQIVDIRTDSFPNYIGREDNEYLYGSAFRVRAFIKQKGITTNG